MTTLITILSIIAVIDTIGGNWWFPGKEGIVKDNEGYYRLYKWNRVFLIPIKMWDKHIKKNEIGGIVEFVLNIRDSYKSETYEQATLYLTNNRKYKYPEVISYTEVFNTKTKTIDHNIDSLLEGITDPEEIRILESIKRRFQ